MLFVYSIVSSQKTTVQGVVLDKETGEVLPFVNIKFKDTKSGGTTNLEGKYFIETYYTSDTLEVTFVGYVSKYIKVKVGVNQTFDIELEPKTGMLRDVIITPPDELPSARLMRLVVKNKVINDREKLEAYEYEAYNKIQIDLSNLGEGFEEMGLVNKLGEVLAFVDSTEQGKFLPILLSESVSKYYYMANPQKKREIMEATYLTGIENIDVSSFMGDMYQNINIYQNHVFLFGKQFISPISNSYNLFYKYYLADSAYIGNQWCYKLTFNPKRKGDLTFSGEMWIHDTTYAVKQIYGDISADANINYVQALHFEQYFDQVEPEVWMLVKEKIFIDFKLTKKSKVYGVYGRKTTMRKEFVIDKPHDPEFYNSPDRVEQAEEATTRDAEYWRKHRHEPLSETEQGVVNMVDSLMYNPTFRFLQNATNMLANGYYRLNKIEIGHLYNFISYNDVEGIRNEIAIRTSSRFSNRVRFTGRLAYGWVDQRVKYGVMMQYNLTPKKRGMLTLYHRNDIEQLGLSPVIRQMGITLGNLLRTGSFDRLTFVNKSGASFEKDFGKDLIIFSGFEWKSLVPLGVADYRRLNSDNTLTNIDEIRSSEFTLRVRWGKNEEFVSGVFDRFPLGSRFPIFTLQAIIGVRDILGSDYNYQKIEFQMAHRARIGYMGELRYNLQAGYVFGSTAYPFLFIHPGNQSFYLQRETFNNMGFFEFISDRYVSFMVDHTWAGLLDLIPGVRRLKWRTVLSFRGVVGEFSARHSNEMILPDVSGSLNWKPYAEVGAGFSNMFNYLRIEFTWRVLQRIQGISNFGIRLRLNLDF
jgi:hypothetical protein